MAFSPTCPDWLTGVLSAIGSSTYLLTNGRIGQSTARLFSRRLQDQVTGASTDRTPGLQSRVRRVLSLALRRQEQARLSARGDVASTVGGDGRPLRRPVSAWRRPSSLKQRGRF